MLLFLKDNQDRQHLLHLQISVKSLFLKESVKRWCRCKESRPSYIGGTLSFIFPLWKKIHEVSE